MSLQPSSIGERLDDALSQWSGLARLLLARGRDGVLAVDRELRITFWNDSMESLMGFPRAVVLGRSLTDVWPGIVETGEIHEVYEALAGRPREPREWEFHSRETGTSGFHESCYVPLAEEGGVRGVVGLFRDVSDRRRVEDLLKESETRFRIMADSAPVLLWMSGIDGRCTFFNKRWLDFTGRPMEREFGDGWAEGIHPEDFQECIDTYMEAFRKRRPFVMEYRLRRRDGSFRWILDEGAPRFSPSGAFAGYVGSCIDITERRETEAALKLSEEQYRSLVELSPEGIFVEREAKFVLANPAVARLLGVGSPSDLTGRDVLPFVDGECRDRFASDLKRVKEGQLLPLAQERWLRPGSPPLVVERSMGAYGRASGSVLVVLRDVTDRVNLERQLREAQKMEAIGRLAGGIAHDFNNLLMIISSYAGILNAGSPASDRRHHYSSEILKACDRATSLTRQLLAFSRRQVLVPRVLDLNAVVSEAESLLRRLIGGYVELVTRLDPTVASVMADPGQIEQVVMNLAVNARDAMPDGGTLLLETYESELGPVAGIPESDLPRGRYVVLAASDTGEGMDATTQMRIFEPFFTTKPDGKGTGLGLATVYGVVKQSGGHVMVESEPGKGTTFRVFLPRVEPEKESTGGLVDVAGSDSAGSRILIVEDEAQVRSVMCSALAELGYTVVEAANGVEALRALERGDGRLDLLVTDLIMPRMDGRELASRLRSQQQELAVLFVSGESIDRLSFPQSEFLQKPFSIPALVETVRKLLAHRIAPS